MIEEGASTVAHLRASSGAHALRWSVVHWVAIFDVLPVRDGETIQRTHHNFE